MFRKMGQFVFSFRLPFEVSKSMLENQLESRNQGPHPSQTTAHRFFPLRLAHIPPPSTTFSARALVVFNVLSSYLDQWGTRPHFILCSSDADSPLLVLLVEFRRITGACDRGAMLCRGTKPSWFTQSSSPAPRCTSG